MTDLEEFEAFFTCMGVVHGTWPNKENGEKILTVSQAHFIFSWDGKYLRVEDDEMGGVHKRIETPCASTPSSPS